MQHHHRESLDEVLPPDHPVDTGMQQAYQVDGGQVPEGIVGFQAVLDEPVVVGGQDGDGLGPDDFAVDRVQECVRGGEMLTQRRLQSGSQVFRGIVPERDAQRSIGRLPIGTQQGWPG